MPAAVAVLLAAVLTACGSGDGPAGPSPDPSGSTAEDGHGHGDISVSHVHGLGIDPADGMLYIATHEGILTVDEQGRAEHVSEDRADYMGFTVAGPGLFYGSGHPEPGSDEPAHRGLIRSTDAGRTWETLSRGGESDFHALEFAHGTVYGYDSTAGMLRVSPDGTAWEDRASIAAADIAVSPEDPDVVLATTQGGVAASADGGRTFASGRQPVLVFLSWAAADGLYGVDPAGELYRSTDGGAGWERSGTVPGGQPQALTAVDSERVLVATQGGIYESGDGGATFTERLALS
ncbi:F510_1955 family glycosylhydrolase [Streptomyces sp. YIM 98790]|uniref:F510_1955 family glycosylhydrolase n=1 Tax=Streptomyces sp. YIM 98790 TaxID=2689077 RepID=UPI00140E349D|nr:exo-alpha-sialidase [Streptomyces sp. YIM 98790]